MSRGRLLRPSLGPNSQSPAAMITRFLLNGALRLFRTNFPRCHALLSFVTSSLASPISRLNSLWKCPNEHFGLLFRTPHTQADGLTLPGRLSTLLLLLLLLLYSTPPSSQKEAIVKGGGGGGGGKEAILSMGDGERGVLRENKKERETATLS